MSYISFIFVARNDDYGGNFIPSCSNCINSLATLCERHGVQAEIIIVEWNPPPEKKPLIDVLGYKGKIACRLIQVSPKIHNNIPSTPYDARKLDNVQLYEYIGKNTGVRRASGQFVVCSNTDIIFNDAIIKMISKSELKDDLFYRIHRHDLQIAINDESVYDERFLRRHSKLNHKSIKYLEHFVHCKASGDFLMMSKSKFESMKGYPELRCDGWFVDSLGVYQASTLCKQEFLHDPYRIYHQKHRKRAQHYNINESSLNSRKSVARWWRRACAFAEKDKKNCNPNPDDWGLLKYELKEYEL